MHPCCGNGVAGQGGEHVVGKVAPACAVGCALESYRLPFFAVDKGVWVFVVLAVGVFDGCGGNAFDERGGYKCLKFVFPPPGVGVDALAEGFAVLFRAQECNHFFLAGFAGSKGAGLDVGKDFFLEAGNDGIDFALQAGVGGEAEFFRRDVVFPGNADDVAGCAEQAGVEGGDGG